MTDANVGFAGLGAMGRGMARNLHKAGLLRAVWNRTTSRADELAVELGVVAAASPEALARECDVVVLCVAADADVLDVVNALLPGMFVRALVDSGVRPQGLLAPQRAVERRPEGNGSPRSGCRRTGSSSNRS